MTVGQFIEVLSQVDPSERLGEVSLKPCQTDPRYPMNGSKTHHLQMIIGDRATVHFVNLKPDTDSGDTTRDSPPKEGMTVGQAIEILSKVDPHIPLMGEMGQIVRVLSQLNPSAILPGKVEIHRTGGMDNPFYPQHMGKTHHLLLDFGGSSSGYYVTPIDPKPVESPKDEPRKDFAETATQKDLLENSVDKAQQVPLAVGDVVQLKSGGPKMTVGKTGMSYDPNAIGLLWLDEEGVLHSQFDVPASCLTKVAPAETRDDLEEWIFSTNPDEDRAHVQLSLLMRVCEIGSPSYDRLLDPGWGEVRTRFGLEWLRQKRYIIQGDGVFRLTAKGFWFLYHWLSNRWDAGETVKSPLQESLEASTEEERRWIHHYESNDPHGK